ncbi:MAG TPA: hypothetical protein VGR67_15960 [Candidatus Polarisedimenticolia bacterium]|jgi:hypothetical protein|nr:hypothetical protein [Candidatus Polarisedimenticolia bacterium]
MNVFGSKPKLYAGVAGFRIPPSEKLLNSLWAKLEHGFGEARLTPRDQECGCGRLTKHMIPGVATLPMHGIRKK